MRSPSLATAIIKQLSIVKKGKLCWIVISSFTYTSSGQDVGLTSLQHRPISDDDGYVMLLLSPRAGARQTSEGSSGHRVCTRYFWEHDARPENGTCEESAAALRCLPCLRMIDSG